MMAVSCSEHLEFQSPVGFADGDLSEPTAEVVCCSGDRLRSRGEGNGGGAAEPRSRGWMNCGSGQAFLPGQSGEGGMSRALAE